MISNCISKRERCLRLSSLQCLVTYFYWMRNGAQVQAEIRASIYLRGLDFWRKCSRYNAAALLELDLWSEPTPTFRRWWFHFYHIWLCLKMRDLLKIAMLMDTVDSQQLSTTLNNSYFVFSMWSVFFTMLINYLLSILYKWGIPIFQLWLYIPISWQCFFLTRLQVDQTITMSCPAAVDVAFCAFTVQATRPAVSTADRRFSWFNHLTWINKYICVWRCNGYKYIEWIMDTMINQLIMKYNGYIYIYTRNIHIYIEFI